MRLIDADELIKGLRFIYNEEGWDKSEEHISLEAMEWNVTCGTQYYVDDDRGDEIDDNNK